MEDTSETARPALASPWAATVDRSLPLPEYPRPSLVRGEWLCLNGPWEYSLRREGAEPGPGQGRILVPFPIESALSGVGRALRPDEILSYRRRVEVPASWRGRRVILHFGAVDWEARVSIGGEMIGSHRGGYAPFSFDITDRLDASFGCELEVEVRDPTDEGSQCRGKQSLRPRGILYTACSGIWGTVWIEPVPESRIARVVAAAPAGARASEGRLAVRAELLAPAGGVGRRRLRAVLKEDGRAVAEASVEVEAGGAGAFDAGLELALRDPKPWTPESPFLYGLSLELEGEAGAEPLDRVESYAAFRTASIVDDSRGRRRIALNGSVRYMAAVLDQGYWPEGVYTAPTDAALASDIERAKELGFDAIRKHAKVEPERWYWHCDRLGMLVWQDIPSGGRHMDLLHSAILGIAGARLRDDRRLGRFGRADPDSRADFESEAAEIVDFLEGFPCVVAWVPFNEGWGQFESLRIARELAERDPTRLVDAASGWYDSGGGHFASRHDYARKPRAPGADRAEAPARPGEAPPAPRAAILSEYGGLTMRVEGHSTEDRRQFGYAGASDAEDLAAQYEALAARLSALAGEGLAASVYTQITDVEIERNGLLTYDRRRVKADAARIRAANLALRAAGGAID